MSNQKTRKDLTDSISQALGEMDAHLAQIKRAMLRIQEDGMYDGIPTESWQTRRRSRAESRENGNNAEYLYMMFSHNHTGRYQGPDGKRKLYIGNKPENIANARRLAQNRAEYNHLARAATQLDYRIGRLDVALTSIQQQAQSFEHTALGKWTDAPEHTPEGDPCSP